MSIGTSRHQLQPQADWDDHLETLLYAGERPHEQITTSETTILVTSHRVLVHTRADDSVPLQTIHRPNLTAAATTYHGPGHLLPRFLQAGVVGAFLLGVSLLVTPAAVSFPAVGDVPGVGGVDQLLGAASSLLAVLETAAFLGGLLAVGVAVLGVGYYLLVRTPVTQLEVAGSEPIVLQTHLSKSELRALETALSPTRNTQSDESHTTA